MANVKDWISSFRLRTLPLALSCVLAGSFIAFLEISFDWIVLSLAALTTILLQVLSNVANDYGDGIKGTDNDQRVGPERAIQSGAISPAQMKTAIYVLSVLSFISGVSLILYSLGGASKSEIIGFVTLGVLSIAAAITYTVGKKAYGYAGLGDIFVFLFFGIVGVCGVTYLHTKSFNPNTLWMAGYVGLMSTAVLNMNNMRDIKNDRDSGKNTLVVKLGFSDAKYYHTFLILASIVCFQMFFWQFRLPSLAYIAFLPAFLFLKNASFVFRNKTPKLLDPELKKLALGTFGSIVLLWVSAYIAYLTL